jgi:CheY-like chemotaxis protein
MKALDDTSSAVPLRSIPGTAILVVDDEGAVRRFALRVLEREGYRVVEARDGIEALELIRQGHEFDAVVSDIVMPRMNGVELMQALSTAAADLPVILMSGYATGALAEQHAVRHSAQAVPSRAAASGSPTLHPAQRVCLRSRKASLPGPG